MSRCIVLLLFLIVAGAVAADPLARCEKVGNDDKVHPYDPSLRPGFLRAYRRLNPREAKPPGGILRGSYFRCMSGKLYACFTGANLPCGKLAVSRHNAGASAYCRANANSDVVPMVATGHETPYSYRCVGTRATITGANFAPDRRGFAKQLWAPME